MNTSTIRQFWQFRKHLCEINLIARVKDWWNRKKNFVYETSIAFKAIYWEDFWNFVFITWSKQMRSYVWYHSDEKVDDFLKPQVFFKWSNLYFQLLDTNDILLFVHLLIFSSNWYVQFGHFGMMTKVHQFTKLILPSAIPVQKVMFYGPLKESDTVRK